MKITVNNAGALRVIRVAGGAQGPQGPIGALNADDRAYVDAAKASTGASEADAAASAATASAAQISSAASAAAASTSEGNAAASEASASTNAATASAAATNLVTALYAFRELFLGNFAADPAVDGNGNPLKDGAEYFNTTTEKIRVYANGAWQDKDQAEQDAVTNAVLAASQAAASKAAASESEANAAASAATASAGAATVAAAVTAASGSATEAAASATSAESDKAAAAASAAAAAQSAIDAENNAGDTLPLAGGAMTGGLSLKYASPGVTFSDTAQVGGVGIFKWASVGGAFRLIRNTAPGGDFSNSVMPLSFGPSDTASFSQDVYAAGTFVQSSPQGNRNGFINGNMDLWSLGTSIALVPATDAITADGWGCNAGTGGTAIVSRVARAPGSEPVWVTRPSKYRMSFNQANPATGGSKPSLFQVFQGAGHYNGQSVAVSCSLQALAAGVSVVGVKYTQAFGTGGAPAATVTATKAVTWPITTVESKFSVRLDIPSVAGKSFGTNDDSSLRIDLLLSTGSTFTVFPTQLQIEPCLSTSSSDLTGAGGTPTPFEWRGLEIEMARCGAKLCFSGNKNGGNYGDGLQTIISWATVLDNSDGAMDADAGIWTCKPGKAGWYEICAELQIEDGSANAGAFFDVGALVNGAFTNATQRRIDAAITTFLSPFPLATKVYLKPGDTLALGLQNGLGGVVTLSTLTNYNWLVITRL